LVYHSKHMRWFLFRVRKYQYDVIEIEEYFIVTCDFIGRRLVSPASCTFMKTRFCKSNCPLYVWSVTEESTVVADDARWNRQMNQTCNDLLVLAQKLKILPLLTYILIWKCIDCLMLCHVSACADRMLN